MWPGPGLRECALGLEVGSPVSVGFRLLGGVRVPRYWFVNGGAQCLWRTLLEVIQLRRGYRIGSPPRPGLARRGGGW